MFEALKSHKTSTLGFSMTLCFTMFLYSAWQWTEVELVAREPIISISDV